MQFFDSLSKQYKKLETNEIKLYVCGPTLYDECHIGHGRVFVVFDVLYRLFLKLNLKVQYIQNITDIDDKIINRAKTENCTSEEIVQKYYKSFITVNEKLNVLKPNFRPTVTNHLKDIEIYIEDLLKKNKAYSTDTGIYFDTSTIDYNFFEVKDCNFERIAHENKRKNADFCLWKFKKDGFDSSFGKGRPGWHIECSAMSEKYLGHSFHIHGGGSDLKFPHHANEIAQSVGKNGKIPADIWMHSEMINLNTEKMSKSKGNCIFLNSILDNSITADALRYFYLSHHYRSMINLDCQFLTSAKNNILNIRKFYFKYIYENSIKFDHSILNILQNDLDTPSLLQLLHNGIKNNEISLVKSILEVLGFRMDKETHLSKDEIHMLINNRQNHRMNNNFSKADEIKKILLDNNIQLEDGNSNTNWYYS